jgi:SH3-like domain-containing protein
MRGRRLTVAGLMLTAFLPASVSAGENKRQPPYWVSLSAGAAMLRAGPGTQFPATWRYVRPDLPLRVLQIRSDWRRVQDPAGTQGWMRSNLLSERRTAMIMGEVRVLRSAPDRGAKVNWRAEPGVVGRVAHCSGGWCEFDVHGRVGYIETAQLWGVEPGETID